MATGPVGPASNDRDRTDRVQVGHSLKCSIACGPAPKVTTRSG